MCVCTHMCAQSLSCVRLFVVPWTVVHQAPLPMGFSRQENWSGFPFPRGSSLPRDRILLPCLWHWQVDSLLAPPGKPWVSDNLCQIEIMGLTCSATVCRKTSQSVIVSNDHLLGSQTDQSRICTEHSTDGLFCSPQLRSQLAGPD